MTGLKNNILNNNIAGDTSNILIPDTSAIKNGIEFKSNINSNVLNGYYNLLSEAIQFLQFTGGLYSEEANYDEGNIASLVIKNGEDYSIWQFRRNANNPQVLNNNPPITEASITTVNGVDAYEGGTLNTDWDKLTEDYAVEAAPNTVMGRDSEGASNVNMPSSIENTTVVNNQYLQQELQTGLAAKQDKLTAGTNVEITEDNIINVKGDVATDAESVSYDNSKTNLEYISGYDFPKFKTPIPDTINLILTDVNKTTEYPATITKQSDRSYVLNASLSNVESLYGDIKYAIVFAVKSIENITNPLFIMNILNIFWNYISTDDWTANNGDIQIEGVTEPLQFEFTTSLLGPALAISKTDLSNFEQKPYNITLTIKNRQYHPVDTYFLGSGDNTSFLSVYLAYLNLQNNNGNIKLVGSCKGIFGVSLTYSFQNILNNYFNLVSSGSYVNTDEITSSTGKAVKYYFMQNASYENAVDLVIAYQDNSTINTDDVFTFNLTPDKNSTLAPVYSPVANVQQAIEVLIKRYNIPLYCYVYPEDDGTFDDRKRPANYYYNLFGVTTVWRKRFSNTGAFFRAEGGLADENRSGLLQQDAIRNITARAGDILCAGVVSTSGAWYYDLINNGSCDTYNQTTKRVWLTLDVSRQVPTSTENRPINIKIEVWELVSINGINIWGE
ncbi:hypothetical protein R4K89_13130 [Brachyspira intermedia]|uniref:hypothetical protein n=1 Tax=Brachyspira intermedia TaxID=84377 RepID=UPI003004F83B